jgi:hypothetical protein
VIIAALHDGAVYIEPFLGLIIAAVTLLGNGRSRRKRIRPARQETSPKQGVENGIFLVIEGLD